MHVKIKKTISIISACLFLAGFLAFFSFPASIAILTSAILILLSIKKIEICIYFLTAYLPFEPFILKFTSDTVYPYVKYGSGVLILIIFLAAIFKHIQKHHFTFQYIKTPIDIPLLIFVFITFISLIINWQNPIIWLLGLRQIFRYVLLYYAIIYSRLSKKTAKVIIAILLILLVIQSSIGIAQAIIGKSADSFLLPGKDRGFANIVSPDYVHQFWASGQRVFSTMGRYDRLGSFLCLVMLLAIGLLYHIKNDSNSGNKKTILLFIILFSLPALLLTYSRLSWIGFASGAILIGAFIKKDKKIIFGSIIGMAIISMTLLAYINIKQIKTRRLTDQPSMDIAHRFLLLFSPAELKTSYDGYGRLYFIINTPMKVVKNNPFFGVGLGQYGSGIAYTLHNTSKYDELRIPFGIGDEFGQIDNNWMSIWGETGTLGLLAFICIFVSLFKHTLKIYKESKDDFSKGMTLGFTGIILAVCIQSFLGPYFEIRTVSFYFWLLAGIVVNSYDKNPHKRHNSCHNI